jgi:hypothetical protein
MFYKLDNETLLYRRDWRKFYVLLFIIVILISSSFIIGNNCAVNPLHEFEKELILINIQQEKSRFTEEKFVNEINRLRIRFPHIVMAQSILETNRWSSRIFIESNNLFGMKEAKARITTASGTHLNHAYYENWMESLYDYGFYQSRYLGKIKTEEEYYLYLQESYAEDVSYVSKLKNIVQKEKLKNLFK